MNKNIVTVVLLLSVMQIYAMEDGAVEVVESVIKSPSLTIEVLKTNTPTEVVLEAVKPSQQNLVHKIISLCKSHPFSVTVCIALVTAVVVYNMVPGVKEKISSLFGNSSYQAEDIEFENHVLPLEKIEIPNGGTTN
jgi:hypothetical protein